METKEGAPRSRRSLEAHVFLRETREGLARTRERIQQFVHRLQQLTERSEALAKRASSSEPEPGLMAELREREAEIGNVIAELRDQYEQAVQARQVLEHERTKYVELFDNAPYAAVETDSRGMVRVANRAFAALVAHPQESLAGKLLIAFVARGDTRTFRRHLLSLRDPRGKRTFQVRIRARGGAPIPTSLSVGSLPGEGAYHWTVRPTVSTQAEVRLLEILALAVNELRGPVTAALGWLQMLRERVIPEWERESILAAVYESAWAQSQLLDDVADIVHARRADPNSRRDLATLTELVARAADIVRPEAARRGVGVVVEQVGPEPFLECDEPRSRRVIARLLLRAVRSMADGGQVRARVMRKADEAVLELHAPGVRALGESLIGIASLTESLAIDGARLVVPTEAKDSLLCSAHWMMCVPSWRAPPDVMARRPPAKDVSRSAE
jgi:PAS domain S-box-containing protein